MRGQRLLDGVGIGRLGEIIDGALFHSGNGGGDVAVAGEHDDADVRTRLAKRSHEFESVAVAQPKVEHRKGRRTADLRQRFRHRADCSYDESAQLERARNAYAERRVIVGDQQRAIFVRHRARA